MARPMPGKKINWVVSHKYFFQMTEFLVTPSSLIIKTIAAITFRKAYIQYYPLFIMGVQNTRSNEAKQKLPQILP